MMHDSKVLPQAGLFGSIVKPGYILYKQDLYSKSKLPLDSRKVAGSFD